MGKSKTDCREKDGIAVGLIDSIIIAARVLRPYFKQWHEEYEERYRKDLDNNFNIPPAVYEALKDLHNDEDLIFILQAGPYNKHFLTDEDRELQDQISSAAKLLKENQAEIKV